MSFEVHEGGAKQKNFICPYCGDSYDTRPELGRHWLTDPRCRENRNVNNPTQSKNMGFDDEIVQPGETQLRLVREHEDEPSDE